MARMANRRGVIKKEEKNGLVKSLDRKCASGLTFDDKKRYPCQAGPIRKVIKAARKNILSGNTLL
jgi:hypothetical protein